MPPKRQQDYSALHLLHAIFTVLVVHETAVEEAFFSEMFPSLKFLCFPPCFVPTLFTSTSQHVLQFVQKCFLSLVSAIVLFWMREGKAQKLKNEQN